MVKKIGIGLGILIVLLVGAFQVMKFMTKKASPEVTANYTVGDADIEIFYCSPSKKGRDVFPEVVPFGEVWRTGANEATTFTTSSDLTIMNKPLKAGTYSLWTIPGEEEWQVIFNTEIPGWGVSWGEKAARNPETDALVITTPVDVHPNDLIEQFTISIEGNALLISWDDYTVQLMLSAT